MTLLPQQIIVFLAVLLLCPVAGIAGVGEKVVAEAIRYESALPNNNNVGYPLPLAAHWNTGWFSGGFDPEYQLAMIEKGHYLLPAFHLSAPWEMDRDSRAGYYEKSIKRAAALNLPITFISTQWERYLTVSQKYFMLPEQDNPNVADNLGTILNKVSPFGPAALWNEVGRKWTSTPLVRKLQDWYPDPPQVFFVSNNEHSKLAWHEAEKSRRYLTAYGPGRDGAFKRKVVGDGWVERYRALQDGMREGMSAHGWGRQSGFIAFDAIGTRAFGRWKDWLNYSLYTKGRMEPWPLAWDGVSAPYYVQNRGETTDHTVMSPQIEAMNWIFMLDEASRLNPDFRLEISTWDGYEPGATDDKRKFYRALGTEFSPKRYEGYVQFGMWLLRPRVVREFRNHLSKVTHDEPYFLPVVNSVDRVHDNPVLKKFWRKGQLVANTNHKHPYQTNIPNEYKNVDRWFLLDNSLLPKRPWKLSTKIPVFAMALVTGEKPKREWLVYAHSPLKAYSGVKVLIPGYSSIEMDVAPEGVFYHVVEKKTIARL